MPVVLLVDQEADFNKVSELLKRDQLLKFLPEIVGFPEAVALFIDRFLGNFNAMVTYDGSPNLLG